MIRDIATADVLVSLLPVIDDIDRARSHGDLTGAFKAVADQLDATLTKLGLEPFGDEGDAFDPQQHEAVMHSESADVSEPTVTSVMRKRLQVRRSPGPSGHGRRKRAERTSGARRKRADES